MDYLWIADRSRPVALSLTTGRLSRPIAVARPEALWVLKMLAGRSQDITDLFAISTLPLDLPEVRDKLASFQSAEVRRALSRVRAAVDLGSDYEDALSRRALGSPKLPRNRKAWDDFRRLVDEMVPANAA